MVGWLVVGWLLVGWLVVGWLVGGWAHSSPGNVLEDTVRKP